MDRVEKYSTAYDLDGKMPLRIAVPLGLQHVLAMFVGNVTPLIIITNLCGIASGSRLQIDLLQNAMFIAGVVTLFQIFPVWRIGCRLPIVMGTSGGYLGVFRSVSIVMGGGITSYSAILGAILIGGFVETFLGFFFKRLRKLFPPVVTGTVLLAVGLSLVDIGVNAFGGGFGVADFGSWENLALAFLVLTSIIVLKHGTSGITSHASILISIVGGYVLAGFLGLVADKTLLLTDPVTGAVSEVTKSWVLDWSKVFSAQWLALPKLVPVPLLFDFRAVVPISLIFVVTTVETLANISAVTNGGLGRDSTDSELSGGIICDGLGSSLAAVFGLLPNTSYSQNVGIIAMTKVVNRYAVSMGAVFLVLCGFFPKLVAVIAVMPSSVLGGAIAMMFASIMVSGIQLISIAKVTSRTFTIVAVSIGVGYGLGANPASLVGFPSWVNLVIGGSGVIPAAFMAIILNLFLPESKEDWEEGAVRAAEPSDR